MKLVSIAALAVVAAAAEDRSSNNNMRQLDGVTTEDLQLATMEFAEAKLGRKKRQNTRSGRGGGDGSLGKRRALRNHTTREGRHHEGDKDGKSGKGGKMGSGKSGKDDEGHEELFYMQPTACANECVSSNVEASHEMVNVLEPCNDHDESQKWLVQSDGSYVMIESYDKPGKCIAVLYEEGDDETMLAETCKDGDLVLIDCHSEYGAEWYFTGGQLVNSLCWASGVPSMMTVFLEDEPNEPVQKCGQNLAVWGANWNVEAEAMEAIMKSDTFMFVNRLPEMPHHMDDVAELLEGGK